MVTCNFWAGVLSCKSRTPQVNFPLLFLNLLMQPPQFFCIICTVYCATFLKIINHDYSLIIPKDRGHHLPCWRNSLKFLRRGEPGCFHCMLCFLDSGSKWWAQVSSWVTTQPINSSVSSSSARQEIPRNIEPASFLIFGQHSGDPSSQDLGYSKDDG